MKPATVLKTLAIIFLLISAQILHLIMTAPAQYHAMYCKRSNVMCDIKMTNVQHAALGPHKDKPL